MLNRRQRRCNEENDDVNNVDDDIKRKKNLHNLFTCIYFFWVICGVVVVVVVAAVAVAAVAFVYFTWLCTNSVLFALFQTETWISSLYRNNDRWCVGRCNGICSPISNCKQIRWRWREKKRRLSCKQHTEQIDREKKRNIHEEGWRNCMVG